MKSILIFFADSNQISAIDPKYFEESENLMNLNLLQNVCVDGAWTVQGNREVVREELEKCFENFEEVPGEPGEDFIRCEFEF